MHKRKIIAISGTLYVSLPKDLAESFGIDEGDEVFLEPKPFLGRPRIVLFTENILKKEIEEETYL